MHVYLRTVCPKSNAPFYIVTYCTKWVTTSWTYSIYYICRLYEFTLIFYTFKASVYI